MQLFFKVLSSEIRKQHLNYFHSKMIYISLFLWPLLNFLSTYYSFKPFNIQNSNIYYLTQDNLIVFLLLGYMAMSLFRSLVQSSWNFSFERISGTLELIYLSPASRQAVILGNAISSLFESIVILMIFTIGLLIIKKDVLHFHYLALIIVIIISLLMAIFWGMLLNILFLFTRDSGFLYTLFEEPMELFSGVRVPTSVFPMWAKAISLIFPLTYSIESIRMVMLNESKLNELTPFIITGSIIILILYLSSLLLLKIVEKQSKITGNFTLF